MMIRSKSRYKGKIIRPAFSKELASNVLKRKGATSTTETVSSHFCEKFGEVIFPTNKITGRNEKEKVIGEVHVCRFCGDIDIDNIKFWKPNR